MNHFENQILGIVRKYCSADTQATITLDTPLDETDIDSLTMSEIIFEIEDVTGVAVPEAGMNGPIFRTLREICAALAENAQPVAKAA